VVSNKNNFKTFPYRLQCYINLSCGGGRLGFSMDTENEKLVRINGCHHLANLMIGGYVKKTCWNVPWIVLYKIVFFVLITNLRWLPL
jgi:hypothetical protein